MRKFTLLIAIISFQVAFSQEEKSDRAFFVEPLFRLHGLMPVDLGDNYLADANKGKLSFGINMSMFEYHNFRLALGFDHVYYDVTDVTKAATVSHSRYNSYYAQIGYEIPVTKAFSVQPYAGFGSSEIGFKRTSNVPKYYLTDEANEISRQYGRGFRGGFYADYRFDKIMSVFAGVGYAQNKFDVATAPEFKTYFEQSKMVQLNFGIKIGYSMKTRYQKDRQIPTYK